MENFIFCAVEEVTNMEFPNKDIFSKCFLRIWSHLLKKSFMFFYGQRNKKQIRNYKFFGMDYLLASLSESTITRKGFLKCHKKT